MYFTRKSIQLYFLNANIRNFFLLQFLSYAHAQKNSSLQLRYRRKSSVYKKYAFRSGNVLQKQLYVLAILNQRFYIILYCFLHMEFIVNLLLHMSIQHIFNAKSNFENNKTKLSLQSEDMQFPSCQNQDKLFQCSLIFRVWEENLLIYRNFHISLELQ